MTLYVFRYTQPWGTTIVGITADNTRQALDHYERGWTRLIPDDLISELPNVGGTFAGIIFEEFVEDPEYDG